MALLYELVVAFHGNRIKKLASHAVPPNFFPFPFTTNESAMRLFAQKRNNKQSSKSLRLSLIEAKPICDRSSTTTMPFIMLGIKMMMMVMRSFFQQ